MSRLMEVKAWVRSGLFFGLFVVGIVCFGLWITLLWPVSSLERLRGWSRRWSAFTRRLLAVTCGLRERVEGLENLPPPPFVILSKHQSAWETVAFLSIFPGCVLVLKQSLMWIPVFGWALKATRQIAIDRSRGVQAINRLQEEGLRQLREEGASVLIFPEGTRSAPGRPGRYNPGGVALALAAGVPIVPVAHNAGSFWPRRSFLKRPGEIRVVIGAPIGTAGLGRYDRKGLQARVEQSIEGMMLSLEEHGVPGDDAPPTPADMAG